MKRVLTARFMHETNTFSRVPTDMAMIRRRDYHLENEIPVAFRGTRSAFGATFEAADKFGWNLVHPVSANPNPSGIVAPFVVEFWLLRCMISQSLRTAWHELVMSLRPFSIISLLFWRYKQQ